MKRWYPQHLHTKIIVIIMSTLLIIFSLLIYFVYDGLKQTTELQMENRGSEIGHYIAALSSEEILLGDNYGVLKLIAKVKSSNEDVRYVVVADYKGRILVHTFGNQYPVGLSVAVEPTYDGQDRFSLLQSDEGAIYEAIVPVEEGKVGFVRVGMTGQAMNRMVVIVIEKILMVAILLAIFGILLVGMLLSRMLMPIRQLSIATEKIKNNNYQAKVPNYGRDELGTLTYTFNEMVDQLAEKESRNTALVAELKIKESNRNVLINKLFTAQEDERKRISRELHDGVGQSVTSILAYLHVLMNKITDTTQRELICSTRDIIISVLEELRQMAVNLRPPSIDDLGLVTTMEKYTYQTAAYHQLKTSFRAEGLQDLILPDNASLALYRILQEAFTNVICHAKASTVTVILIKKDGFITMSITDDGCGFSEETLRTAKEKHHLGLYGMQERVELLNGTLRIQSKPKMGTKIIAAIPIKGE